MRILLDTNVIIYSEDNIKLAEDIQLFHQLSEKHKVRRYVHEKSTIDIEQDGDEERRKITLSKLEKYPTLEFSDTPNQEYKNVCGEPATQNDEIDDCILFSIQQDAANYLITEDKGIHAKAIKLQLEDRVFKVKEFSEFLKKEYENVYEEIPTIKRVYVRDLDLNDDMFDTLRSDYPEFDDWFKRISGDGREAWVTFSGSKLSSICIFDPSNDEYNGDMKICTFKVADEYQGSKLGEQLLRQAFNFASENGKTHVFVQVKKDKERLIKWFDSFGFQYVGERIEKNESVLKKVIKAVPEEKYKIATPLELAIRYFPFYVEPPHEDVSAFLVPIKPKFTESLFPDLGMQEKLPGFEHDPCGNAIKKAYVCKTGSRQYKEGDLLLFYESEKRKGIIAKGVVEDILITGDAESVLGFIGKRSVYSIDQIQEMAGESDSDLVAIKFLYIGGLPSVVTSDKLISEQVIKRPPQSFQDITEKYTKIKNLL